MKRIVSIVFLSSLFFVSCSKDEINNTETQVGSSKVIFFPSVATKGEKLVLLTEGDAYTDAGATATINGAEVAYETSTSVNTSIPGVYNLVYTAKNAEGFEASDWRTVVVIGKDVAANDYSGTYMRFNADGTPFGVSSTWTKKAPGVYEVDNPGGAASGVGYKVIVVNYQGNKIKMPRQLAVDPDDETTKEVSTTSETYTATSVPAKYSWVFLAGGYGTATRYFQKQ